MGSNCHELLSYVKSGNGIDVTCSGGRVIMEGSYIAIKW